MDLVPPLGVFKAINEYLPGKELDDEIEASDDAFILGFPLKVNKDKKIAEGKFLPI